MSEMASRLRALHHASEILVLPNAWDVASARIFEEAGFAAIATTSAGVAWSNGVLDGQILPLTQHFDLVRTITARAAIPLTCDLEKGYAENPEAIAGTIKGLVEAGGAGCNLEDAMENPEILSAKIRAARHCLKEIGGDLVINARIDTYLRGKPDFEETLRCAALYTEAGADSIFVPAVTAESDIAKLVKAIRLPLNVLVWPGVPPISVLQRLGVRRLSTGARITDAAYAHVRDLAASLKGGDLQPVLHNALTQDERKKLFGR